jgi:hypothetical protein
VVEHIEAIRCVAVADQYLQSVGAEDHAIDRFGPSADDPGNPFLTAALTDRVPEFRGFVQFGRPIFIALFAGELKNLPQLRTQSSETFIPSTRAIASAGISNTSPRYFLTRETVLTMIDTDSPWGLGGSAHGFAVTSRLTPDFGIAVVGCGPHHDPGLTLAGRNQRSLLHLGEGLVRAIAKLVELDRDGGLAVRASPIHTLSPPRCAEYDRGRAWRSQADRARPAGSGCRDGPPCRPPARSSASRPVVRVFRGLSPGS